MVQSISEDNRQKTEECLEWFAKRISVFSKEEQDAIYACAIAIVDRNQINTPNTPIPINEQYSQASLMQDASQAFFYEVKAERISPLSLSLSLPPTSPPVSHSFTKRCQGRKRQAGEG